MKSVADIVVGREPTDDEAATRAHVLELARAWERGDLPLASVRMQCSGYERWTAMRFAGVRNAEKTLLRCLLDALVGSAGDGGRTKHGWFGHEDLSRHEAWIVRAPNGLRLARFPTWTSERGKHYRDVPEYTLEEGTR